VSKHRSLPRQTTPRPKNEYEHFGKKALLSQTKEGEKREAGYVFREVKIQNLLRYLEEKKLQLFYPAIILGREEQN
jgi:hypothetical protein